MSHTLTRMSAEAESARESLLHGWDVPSGAMTPSSHQLAYQVKSPQPKILFVILQRELVIGSHLASGSIVYAPVPLEAFAAPDWLMCPSYPRVAPTFVLAGGDSGPLADLAPSAIVRNVAERGLYSAPHVQLKEALQRLGLTYTEVAEILGISRQTLHHWIKKPNVDHRDVHQSRIRALAQLGEQWERRVGDRPIPRWCLGSSFIAEGGLLDHLRTAVQEGRDIAEVLDQVEVCVRQDMEPPLSEIPVSVPMPLSDQELAMRALEPLEIDGY